MPEDKNDFTQELTWEEYSSGVYKWPANFSKAKCKKIFPLLEKYRKGLYSGKTFSLHSSAREIRESLDFSFSKPYETLLYGMYDSQRYHFLSMALIEEFVPLSGECESKLSKAYNVPFYELSPKHSPQEYYEKFWNFFNLVIAPYDQNPLSIYQLQERYAKELKEKHDFYVPGLRQELLIRNCDTGCLSLHRAESTIRQAAKYPASPFYHVALYYLDKMYPTTPFPVLAKAYKSKDYIRDNNESRDRFWNEYFQNPE